MQGQISTAVTSERADKEGHSGSEALFIAGLEKQRQG